MTRLRRRWCNQSKSCDVNVGGLNRPLSRDTRWVGTELVDSHMRIRVFEHASPFVHADPEPLGSQMSEHRATASGGRDIRTTSAAAAIDSLPVLEGAMTGCTARADVFQHRLLEEPPTSSAPRRTRERYDQLVREAKTVCAACPLFTDCLFNAVVEHDVTGFAAGTTAAQRRSMRHLLAVDVQADDFDQLAGARGTRRPVSHEEVLRLRTQYPNDSLESLAMRLGCSLSTVKRHLRRARRGQSPAAKAPRSRPTVEAVLDAFDTVTETPCTGRRSNTTRVA